MCLGALTGLPYVQKSQPFSSVRGDAHCCFRDICAEGLHSKSSFCGKPCMSALNGIILGWVRHVVHRQEKKQIAWHVCSKFSFSNPWTSVLCAGAVMFCVLAWLVLAGDKSWMKVVHFQTSSYHRLFNLLHRSCESFTKELLAKVQGVVLRICSGSV